MIQHPIGTVVKLTDLTNYQSCINRIRSSPPPYRITLGNWNEMPPGTNCLQQPEGMLSTNQPISQDLEMSRTVLENNNRFRHDLQQIEHDVRSASSIILGYAELIASGSLGEDLPNQKNAVLAILNNSKTLKNSLNLLNLYTALFTGSYMWLDFEFGQLLLNSFSDFIRMGDANQVSIQKNILAEECWVQGDPELVLAAIHYLIEEAVGMSRPESTIWLNLSQKGETIELKIVAEEYAFCPSDFINKSQWEAHSGSNVHAIQEKSEVEISLAREIIETFGGKLTTYCQPDIGVIFQICLPIPFMN